MKQMEINYDYATGKDLRVLIVVCAFQFISYITRFLSQ